MWQLRQLEAFHQAMTTGSLTRAAEKLYVSQPAVSKLISMLEKKCGFPLFTRRGNRLQPTTEGEMLYAEIQPIFARTQDIEQKVMEIREHQVGTLRIVAFPAMATRVLPGIIARFCADKPNVEVLLTGRSSVFMVDWIPSQRIDLGISILAANEHGLSSSSLLSVDAVCVLPFGHHLSNEEYLTPAQIANEPLIALGSEDKARFLVDQFFETANVKAKSLIQTQLSEAACQFVVEGAGIAIVDPFSAMGFMREQLVVKRISQRIIFNLWLIVPTTHPSSRIASSFIDFFSDEIKDVLRRNDFSFS